jgi:hypothetical protein
VKFKKSVNKLEAFHCLVECKAVPSLISSCCCHYGTGAADSLDKFNFLLLFLWQTSFSFQAKGLLEIPMAKLNELPR